MSAHTGVDAFWVLCKINPEPWSAPTIGKKGGNFKSGSLVNYQEAVRSLVTDAMLKNEVPPYTYDSHAAGIFLEMFFWRSTGKGQPADTSNLVKATEDALQGALFDNDRIVRRVAGEIVEQSPALDDPGVLIRCTDYPETGLSNLSDGVWRLITVSEDAALPRIKMSLGRDGPDDFDF